MKEIYKSYVEKIQELREQKNAIILAHYYQRAEIQAIADYIGDSLGLAQQASQTDAKIILFCGVHFMGESAKILAPEKKVLVPDMRAGCPMADMVDAQGLRALKAKHPDATVVAYVNTSAEVKAETDICCTSSNAVKVIQSVKTDKIIWVPDKNLGNYVSKFTDKQVILWQGYCNTHDQLTATEVERCRNEHPGAPVVVHPECRPEVVELADHVASTAGILKYCIESAADKFIIGTEQGINYKLQLDSPHKQFVFPSNRLVCPNMKLNNLPKILAALQDEQPEIIVDQIVAEKARLSLQRMLEVY